MMQLFRLFVFVAVSVFSLHHLALATEKVPVEIGEGVVTVTIPLVIEDASVVLQMVAEKGDRSLKKGKVNGYAVEVYYPETWDISATGIGQGLYSVTFKMRDREGNQGVSFELDVKNPLNNLDEKEREWICPALLKGLGSNKLVFSPERGQVRWIPAPYKDVRKRAGLDDLEDELLVTEKLSLPLQKGAPPFLLEKVGFLWGVDRKELEQLISLEEVLPYLAATKESPIRVKEGFLSRQLDPHFQGKYVGNQGWEWVIIKNRTVIQVIPFLEYFVAVK